MAQSSPLFSGSMELLAHAIEHYSGNSEQDRRMAVLHLASAVELVLKDRMLDLSISIYRQPKESKGFYTLIEDLARAGVQIPQRPLLEVLMEERDSLESRFSTPSESMVRLCMEGVLRFFEGFLSQGGQTISLKEQLRSSLSEELLQRVYPEQPLLAGVTELAKQQPTIAFLAAWAEMEKRVRRLKEIVPPEKTGLDKSLPEISWLLRFIRDNKLNLDFPTSLWAELADLTLVRGSIVHDKMVLDRASGGKLVKKLEQLAKDMDLLLEKVEEGREAG